MSNSVASVGRSHSPALPRHVNETKVIDLETALVGGFLLFIFLENYLPKTQAQAFNILDGLLI